MLLSNLFTKAYSISENWTKAIASDINWFDFFFMRYFPPLFQVILFLWFHIKELFQRLCPLGNLVCKRQLMRGLFISVLLVETFQEFSSLLLLKEKLCLFFWQLIASNLICFPELRLRKLSLALFYYEISKPIFSQVL